MSSPDVPETTWGGMLGKVLGRVKEVAGELVRNDDLAREGRLQQAQADAQAVAQRRAGETNELENEQQLEAAQHENALERERLRAEIAESDRDAVLEATRQQRQLEAAEREVLEVREAERKRRAGERAAATAEHSALSDRVSEEQRISRTEQNARRAERTADIVDPEDNE